MAGLKPKHRRTLEAMGYNTAKLDRQAKHFATSKKNRKRRK